MTNRAKGVLYTGVTSDIARRAFEHREGLVPGFTKRYGLKRLVYMEFHERIADAIQRESGGLCEVVSAQGVGVLAGDLI
jgi:putative endonuclease